MDVIIDVMLDPGILLPYDFSIIRPSVFIDGIDGIL
jgi:hypothetical protein